MNRLTAATLVVYFLDASFAKGFESGDKVIVIAPVEMKTTTEASLALSPGTLLTVQKIEQTRLFVVIGRLGWIDPAAVIAADKADDYFSTLVEKDPSDAAVLLARGKVRFDQGKHEQAIADLDQSLKLAENSEAHTIRGFAWKRSGNKEKAMADLDQAIELDPKNALAWRVRGATFASYGDYRNALAHYTESIRLDPENPDTLLHRTMLLSACLEDDSIRDGKQALKDATKSCELSGWLNPMYMTGLAAAYAELGDFESAVKWQTKVIELTSNGTPRLDLYRQGKPFRASWVK